MHLACRTTNENEVDNSKYSANEAGNPPKRRTAVFRGKYDRGVPWVFCGGSGNDPRHRPWAMSRVVASGGPEGEARRRSPTKKPANLINATKTPQTHKHRKKRTAHSERRQSVQNTTTGGVNPSLLIIYFRRKFSQNDGKSPPKRHKTAIFACGAGGLIHRQILLSALLEVSL